MPAPNAGEGGKKKKVSKKEALRLEQQRLIEEAHKAEEAELQRQAAEERKQREEEHARAVVAQQVKNAETERLLHQARHDHRYIARQQRLIEHLHSTVSQQEEWEKYLQCNPLPDVTREAELNTYLSLWRDAAASSSTPHTLLASLVNSCSISESIVHALSEAHSLAREEHDLPSQSFLSSYQLTLRDLIESKLDSLTSSYLSHSDQYHDAQHTLAISHHSEHVDYALWVHGSAKHGRVKKIDWPDVGMTIELPVALQQSRIAIRCIRTTYDHISGREEDAHAEAETAEEREERERALEVKRALRAPHHFTSVGGMISIEQLALPPPPKQAKGWAMRELAHTNSALQLIPYPNDEAPQSSSQPAHPATTGGGAAGQSNAPMRLSFHIPPSIYLPQAVPHFGWYDAQTHAWRQDGISLLSFDSATRLTHLSLSTLKPIALIQPRALDFPYRQWYLHTNGAHCELLLKGSRYDTTILIQHGQCRLLNPVHPLLASVNESSLPPGRLLLAMQQLGINVLPTDEDGDYCRKPPKNSELLEALHGHISQVVECFDLGGMEMNSGRGEHTAMLRVRINLHSGELTGSRDKRRRWEEKRDEDEWWRIEQEQDRQQQQHEEQEVKEQPPPAEPSSDDELDDPAAAEQKLRDAQLREEKQREDAERKEKEAAAVKPSTPPVLSPEQIAERRTAWATVLVTLTDIDGEQVAPFPTIPLPFGTIPEYVPGGHHLLRFLMVKGATNGQLDLTALPGQSSHVSLRRCLYEYYKGVVGEKEGELASALDMSEEVRGELRFLPVDEQRLHHQQTVRKMLNLTNVFRFF